MKYVTASRAGLVSCHACGRVDPRIRSVTPQHCSRCGARLHRRNPDSLMRTWALLIAAALLYIPANLLPVMHTASLLGSEDDTIMSGVVYFWTSGDWPLAVIVFIASIMVPMLKLSVLVLLTVTAQRRSRWRPMQRTKLYRIVEHIGRWSMLDVFVVTLTVALVRFQSIAVITAGPGAIAFGSVVILTMIASMQFDPRLIWDPLDGASGSEGPRGRTSIRSTHNKQGAPDARTQEAGTPRAGSSNSAQGVTPPSQDLKHD
jgi:paraquat-inducible protein A